MRVPSLGFSVRALGNALAVKLIGADPRADEFVDMGLTLAAFGLTIREVQIPLNKSPQMISTACLLSG